MRRITILLTTLFLVVALVITGCAKPAPAPPPAPAPAPAPAPTPPPAPPKPIELRVAVFLPDAPGIQAESVKWWISEVEKRTKGKVKLTSFWGGALLKPKEIFDGVEAQTVDMGFMSMGHHGTEFSELLPGAGPNKFHYSSAPASVQAWWQLYREFPEYEAAFTARNFKLLWHVGIGTIHIFSTKPTTTLASLKGLKSRSGGKIEPKLMEAAGCVPVSMPVIEAYDALSKGLLQVATFSHDVAQQYKIHEVTKYLVLADLGPVASVVCMVINLDSWNKLPKDVQQVMLDTSEESFDVWAKMQYKFMDEAPDFFRGEGLEILEFSTADREKWSQLPAVAKLRADYIAEVEAKGLPGQKINDRWLALEAEMEARYGPNGTYWK